MNEKYPLYPTLPEEGQREAEKLVEAFKILLTKAADEAIRDLYCNILPYIESDAWSNFRNEMMDGFTNYANRKIQGEYDFKKIRQAILKEHRGDIIKDLNRDLIEEIGCLKKQLKYERELRRVT